MENWPAELPLSGDFGATGKRSLLDIPARPLFDPAMMNAGRHSNSPLRIAATVLCFVFAVASMPSWLMEGLCRELCCSGELLAPPPPAPSDDCCAAPAAEAEAEKHEHRPSPCPLRWCCENGDYTPILQSPPALPLRAESKGDHVANALLAMDAAREEQQARHFVAEASPPKSSPVPAWLSHASILI